jgi:hypothetical protein
MKNIALTVAAILVATSSAFAGSDHYGSSNASQTTTPVDSTYTASVRKQDKQDKVKHDMVQQGAQPAMNSAADEPGQGIWGN